MLKLECIMENLFVEIERNIYIDLYKIFIDIYLYKYEI